MKDRAFGVLQRIGRSFMLPIAILPVAGLLLGLGSSFTNATTIETYRLGWLLGEGTLLHSLLVIMNKVGGAVFDNLPLIFAVGVAIGMAKKEKEVSALAALIAFFVMQVSISGMLVLSGQVLADGTIAPGILEGTITPVCGIPTLQMGVFGGIIVGLGVAALHNRFHKIELPSALSFFGGSRFVPIISTIVYLFVGILLYYIWPTVQNGIYALGGLVTGTGYFGTLIFGIVKRALIPFGLHHVFYMPFWQTAVGGTMNVAGKVVQGGQNIFFAQLADAANVAHFSADATRYFSGEFIFMIFGLPGAALAMYQTAKPEKRRQAGSLLFSASLACMLTGITEPIEFSFLFVAPMLFVVQVFLAGTAYMIAHILNIAVGLTFSGGLIDLLLFGVLQGNDKTSWTWILPVGVIYFLLYYLIFRYLILKYDLKTPGREADEHRTRLYTKADVRERNGGAGDRRTQGDTAWSGSASGNAGLHDQAFGHASGGRSAQIVQGLGGIGNIEDVDCCATRLRCSVRDAGLVREDILRATGASGVIRRGSGVQIIYGPQVTVIKSDLEDYMETAPELEVQETEMLNIRMNPRDQVTDRESLPAKDRQMECEPENKVQRYYTEHAGNTGDAPSGRTIIIASPMTGYAADLSTAPDEVFAEKMAGDGAVVTPTDSVVYSPDDGEIALVFGTKHAIGIHTDSGVDLLIHVGIETVKLNGQGFEALVTQGQRVKKGDPLLRLDLPYLNEHAHSMVTPVLCTDLEAGQKVRLLKEGHIRAGEALFEVYFG